MKRNKLVSMLLCTAMAISCLAGCGTKDADKADATQGDAADVAGEESGELSSDIEATLTLASYSPTDSAYFESADLEGEFQKLYPNVTIKIEEYKDTSEYDNALKTRVSAGEMPDLFYMQPTWFMSYVDQMMDLSDTEAAANNLYADAYAIDGAEYMLATCSSDTYVFYWEDMFKEAGITEIPDTWDEFYATCDALKAHYTAENPQFVTLGIGAKDQWPVYPFMEYMPALMNKDGDYWSTMGNTAEPFTGTGDVATAYKKSYDLFTAGYCGEDPLGVGHDQLASLFYEQELGMMVFAPSLYDAIVAAGVDVTGLSSFYLPTRETEDEEFRTLVSGNNFMCASNTTENPELVKAFVEFFFSEAWYPGFIGNQTASTALTNISVEKPATLQAADDLQPEPVQVVYVSGDAHFTDVQTTALFNYQQLGAEFFIDGFDFEGTMEDWNAKWSAALAEVDGE